MHKVLNTRSSNQKVSSIVYSYIWLHSKDVELEADKETCELIKKTGK